MQFLEFITGIAIGGLVIGVLHLMINKKGIQNNEIKKRKRTKK